MEVSDLVGALSWIDAVAAVVWVLLTIIMLWILFRIYVKLGSNHGSFYFGIFLLALVWLYPAYTYMFNQLEVGLAGNLLTLTVSIVYQRKLVKIQRLLGIWMLPQIIWLILATFYVTCLILLKYQGA